MGIILSIVRSTIISEEDGTAYPAFRATLTSKSNGREIDMIESLFPDLLRKKLNQVWPGVVDQIPTWFDKIDLDNVSKVYYEVKTGADSMVLADGVRIAFFVEAADAALFVAAREASDRKARNAKLDDLIKKFPDKAELINRVREPE